MLLRTIPGFVLVGSLFSALVGCLNERHSPNVSSIDVNVKMERFEKDLFNINPDSLPAEAAKVRKKYPEFYPTFFAQIMRNRNPQDSNNVELLEVLLTNHDFKLLKHDVDSVYPTVDKFEAQFTDAFKHYKYYFPQGSVPQVLTYIADFQYGANTVGKVLAVELDMFLGSGYRFYQSEAVNLPQYIQRKLNQDHLVPVAMKAFAQGVFPAPGNKATLLDQMIYEGKMLYFLDAVLPNAVDSVKIGLSPAQLKWAKAYEADIWTDFMAQELLYSTDELKFGKYLADAPFTSGLDNDSSPMLGVWTGWQIVRKYMEEHPSLSLAQLMEHSDSQKLLKESKYKPKP